MNEFEQKWQTVLDLLKPEVPEVTYKTFLSPLKLGDVTSNPNTINILCDKEFSLNLIKSRYMHLLEGFIGVVFNDDYKVNLVLSDENSKSASPILKKPEQISTTSTINEEFDNELIINPTYTFENFVVGPTNEFAYSAALSVAEKPADAFNPLYLYGDSGLGKTHLMHAICSHILNHNVGKKVLYVTSEMFTNEIITAIRTKTQFEFRQKYRQPDVLLIDDVQFFQGKDQIQEEVFNTFNSLYDNNKQIVISSDRPPKELTGLDERLRSRFGWNIIADIKKPTFETRMAILYNKAEQEHLTVDENVETVLNMIAERMHTNVRELEGAFTNLVSMSRVLNKDITPQFAKETLKNIFIEEEKNIDAETIKRTVSKYFDITVKDLEGKKRSREIAHPRQIAMYLTRVLTDLSLPKIGKAFGGKDHTTVLHAYEKIAEEINTNESTKIFVNELTEKIKL